MQLNLQRETKKKYQILSVTIVIMAMESERRRSAGLIERSLIRIVSNFCEYYLNQTSGGICPFSLWDKRVGLQHMTLLIHLETFHRLYSL